MKRRITEMMEDVDPTGYQELELSEEEIERWTEGIDFDRLEHSILEQVGTQSQSRPKPKKKKWGTWYKILLAALVASICLTSSVYAYQKGYFEEFFNISYDLTDKAIIRVNESKISAGVKMTLSEVLPGERDAVLLMVFEREDGKPFPRNTELTLFDFGLENGEIAGENSRRGGISDDGNRLFYELQLQGNEAPLKGNRVSIHADTLYYNTRQQEQLTIDLAEFYAAYPLAMSLEDIAEVDEWARYFLELNKSPQGALPVHEQVWEMILAGFHKQQERFGRPELTATDEYPPAKFAGVGFSDGQLIVGLYTEAWEGLDRTEEVLRDSIYLHLQDERKTDSLSWSHVHPYELSEDERITLFTFPDIMPSDLPYLSLISEYEHKQVLSEGKWDLMYAFTNDGLTLKQPFDQVQATKEGALYHLTQINISVLEVLLYGEWDSQYAIEYSGVPPYSHEASLLMQNGEEIPLEAHGGFVDGSSGNRFKYTFALPRGENELHSSIDQTMMDQIKAVIVNGETIIIDRV